MPIVNQNDATAVSRYTEFIRQSPNAQITQDTGWAHVKNNWEPLYAYVENEQGAIAGALSILISDTPSGYKFAYASKGPVVPYGDVAMLNALVAEVKATLIEKNVYLLRLDPEWRYDEALVQSILDAGYKVRGRNLAHLGMHATIQPRLNMVIDLTKHPEAETLFDMVPSKTKNKLRKPSREGVVVDYGLTDDFLDDFYATYVTMSQRHEISHRPKDYFARMIETYKNTDIMRIYRAKLADETLATTIGFDMGDKVWDMYAGSVDHDKTNALYATRVAMVEWALATGKRRYDIGGIQAADESDGLYKFKRNIVRDEPTEYLGEIDVVLNPAAYADLVQE